MTFTLNFTMKPPTFFYPALLSSLAFLDCASSKPNPKTSIDLYARMHGNQVSAALSVRVHGNIFRIQYSNHYHSLASGIAAVTWFTWLERQTNRAIRKCNYNQERIWQRLDRADGIADRTVHPRYLEDFINHPKKYGR